MADDNERRINTGFLACFKDCSTPVICYCVFKAEKPGKPHKYAIFLLIIICCVDAYLSRR